MTPDPDVLLAWLADRHRGPLGPLYRTVAWYAGEAADSRDVRRLVWDLCELGILAVDTTRRRWEAQPPRLAELPGRGSLALFAGAVSEDQIYAAEGPGVRLTVHRNERPGRLPLPSTWWLAYEDDQALAAAAARGGMPVEPEAAVRRSTALCSIAPTVAVERPGRQGSELERWNRRTSRFQPADRRILGDGLYRRDTYGRKEYLLCRAGTWFATTGAEGRYLVDDNSGLPLRWRSDGEGGIGKGGGGNDGGDALGALIVDMSMPLPATHGAVAALCTGLPPVRDGGRQEIVYDGVPLGVADRIARSLHSSLKVC
ncbi:hypothetical protein CC117_20920 [Parafrankia colletiae]|uniref:Uncharacterized protein n=1 Tax=Parafrankia colletiae TaxID=573497 RepID=A0A1S1QL12_9ACTN|nr:hypothetical protein [Parafrankia colletiae]MCK9900604.1 hypothetical protein [Frankia sp. Cpl3]OHV34670.1 hypothetical protein CC117_20920 [Parafrankia colletiae]